MGSIRANDLHQRSLIITLNITFPKKEMTLHFLPKKDKRVGSTSCFCKRGDYTCEVFDSDLNYFAKFNRRCSVVRTQI